MSTQLLKKFILLRLSRALLSYIENLTIVRADIGGDEGKHRRTSSTTRLLQSVFIQFLFLFNSLFTDNLHLALIQLSYIDSLKIH